MTDAEMLILVFGGSGLFMCLLTIPMALKKVRPNGLYGFRTPKTLANEEAWYAVNRIAGIEMSITGAILTAFAAFCYFTNTGWSEDTISYIAVVICFVGIGISIIHGLVVLRRY